MRSFLPIAWRRCSRVDIYAWSDDGTWGLERGTISDTSHHTFSNMNCIEANILIDKDGNARLADFGLLTIISDSTQAATTILSESCGTLRWVSPELLEPNQFRAKNGQPTKESDCYALGMVVLEVLTGKAPFQGFDKLAVMRKVIDGERPGRPKGPEAVWFTDDLWGTLDQCWSYKPRLRPTVESVLECLEQHLVTWQPLQADSDDDTSFATNHRSCAFFYLVFDLASPVQSSCSR